MGKYEFDSIRRQIDSLEKFVEERDKVANTATGKLQRVNSISFKNSLQYFNVKNCNSNTYCYKPDPDVSERVLNALFEEAKKEHEANQPAIQNNLKVWKNIQTILKNIGISEYSYVYKTSRSTKQTKVQSPWIDSIRGQIITDDGFSVVETRYKRYMEEIQKWRRTKEDMEKAKEQEQIAAEGKRKRDLALAKLILKYGMVDTSEPEGVLCQLLERDKYLRLAHYLRLNRSDWNDGPNYAQNGLSKFEVVTEEDAAISNEIEDLISDWDGDGRCFRDCTYNYDYLFGKVSKELLADYEVASTLVDLE